MSVPQRVVYNSAFPIGWIQMLSPPPKTTPARSEGKIDGTPEKIGHLITGFWFLAIQGAPTSLFLSLADQFHFLCTNYTEAGLWHVWPPLNRGPVIKLKKCAFCLPPGPPPIPRVVLPNTYVFAGTHHLAIAGDGPSKSWGVAFLKRYC